MRNFFCRSVVTLIACLLIACTHIPATKSKPGTFSPMACKPGGLTTMNLMPTNSTDALNYLQGEWTMSARWPAMFRVQDDKVIWLGNGKTYQGVMQGNALVGDITDEDGITCHLEISGGPAILQIKRSQCVDRNKRPANMQSTVGNFVKTDIK